MKKEWVYKIKDQCEAQGATFHFKQWGTIGEDGTQRTTKDNGHLLDGVEYMDVPQPYGCQLELF